MLFDEDLAIVVKDIADDYLEVLLDEFTDAHSSPDNWMLDDISRALFRNLQIKIPPKDSWGELSKPDNWHEYLLNETFETFNRRSEIFGEEMFHQFVRYVALRIIDDKWKDHLYDMDRLKEGVGLRAYGQKDPLIEFKKEGFDLFSTMLESANEETLRVIFNSVVKESDERSTSRSASRLSYIHSETKGLDSAQASAVQENQAMSRSLKKQPVKVEQTTGRNDPCHCGSGKKYKKCCGA